MVKDVRTIKACPECGSSNIVKSKRKQQVICKDCGLIYEPLNPKEEKKFEKASDVV